MSSKKFDQLETQALRLAKVGAPTSCDVTYLWNDSSNFKIGNSSILGENVALTIDCNGVISGTFSGTFLGISGGCCVGGSDGDVQYNDSGTPGGDSSFHWDGSKLKVPDLQIVNIIDNGIPVATSDGTMESDPNLTFDGSELTVVASASFSGGDFSIGTDQLFVEGSTGLVGINNNAPLNKLTIGDEIATAGGTGIYRITIGNTSGHAFLNAGESDKGKSFVGWDFNGGPGAPVATQPRMKLGTTQGPTTYGNILIHSGNFGVISTGNNPVCGVQIIRAGDATDGAFIDQYQMCIGRSNDTADLEAGIAFRVSSDVSPQNNAPGAAITHARKGSNSQGDLHFKTREDGTVGGTCATRMTITQDGGVLINALAEVATPKEKLGIVGGTDQNNVVLVWGDAQGTGEPYLGFGFGSTPGTPNIMAGRSNHASKTDLEIYTANAGGSEVLHVTFNGTDQSTDFEGPVDVTGDVTADNIFVPEYLSAYYTSDAGMNVASAGEVSVFDTASLGGNVTDTESFGVSLDQDTGHITINTAGTYQVTYSLLLRTDYTSWPDGEGDTGYFDTFGIFKNGSSSGDVIWEGEAWGRDYEFPWTITNTFTFAAADYFHFLVDTEGSYKVKFYEGTALDVQRMA